MHRAGKLEVVEAAGSNGDSSRGGKGRGVLPGGGGALALGGGIALLSIIRQLPYVPLSFLRRLKCHCHRFRVLRELRRAGGYILRTVAFLEAWVLAEPKARAVRTPDLANISAERVSALETAREWYRGGVSSE